MDNIVLRFNDYKYFDLFEEIESGIQDDTGTTFSFTGRYYVFGLKWEEKAGTNLRPTTVTCRHEDKFRETEIILSKEIKKL